MDARRARQVHRNATPQSSCGSIPLMCQVSKRVPRGSGRPPPQASTASPAARVPPRGPGHQHQPPPALLPWPLRRRPSELARSSAFARRGSCGVGLADALGQKRPRLSLRLQLAAPAPPGSLSAVPAPRAPAGREGRLRLRLRCGAERFLRNLPPSSSSLLWAKREAKSAPCLSPSSPSPSYSANCRAVGGPERKGELFRVRVPSRAVARYPPFPPRPRAPMTRGPALFERLPGSPAARRAGVGAPEGRAPPPLAGVAPSLPSAWRSLRRIPSCLARAGAGKH